MFFFTERSNRTVRLCRNRFSSLNEKNAEKFYVLVNVAKLAKILFTIKFLCLVIKSFFYDLEAKNLILCFKMLAQINRTLLTVERHAIVCAHFLIKEVHVKSVTLRPSQIF